MLLSAVLATFCNASYDYYRLPRSIKPQHYNLRIMTHLENPKRFIFTGDVEILLRIIQSTNNITLHAGASLNIAECNTGVQLMKYHCNELIEIKSMQRQSKYNFVILHFEQYLQRGQRYTLRMRFWSRLGQGMAGYYVSSYQDNADNCCKQFVTSYQIFLQCSYPFFSGTCL